MISLEDFLCSNSCKVLEAASDPFSMVKSEIDPFVGAEICDIGSGYKVHAHTSNIQDVFLLHDGTLVGFYFGELVSIRSDHRGKALSVPIILHAVIGRERPLKRVLTAAGKQALINAWQVANGLVADPWPPKPDA